MWGVCVGVLEYCWGVCRSLGMCVGVCRSIGVCVGCTRAQRCAHIHTYLFVSLHAQLQCSLHTQVTPSCWLLLPRFSPDR